MAADGRPPHSNSGSPAKAGNAQMQTAGYHSEEVSQLYQLARDAALALDQQDEAAEAGIGCRSFYTAIAAIGTSSKSATTSCVGKRIACAQKRSCTFGY